MKRVWRKKEGVSPVIATILMVAITVVLAAVLYVMVMQYVQEPTKLMSGSLFYQGDRSSPREGVASFEVALQDPSNPELTKISVKVMDANQTRIGTGVQVEWKHIVSDDTHVQGGDRLVVSAPGMDLSNYEVVISIDGYNGALSSRITS